MYRIRERYKLSVYGIDMGTTYTCIAKVNDDGKVEAIRNVAEQKTTMASAVFFDDDGYYIVGDSAKEAILDAPGRVCQFFKRYIGRPELLKRARANEPNIYIIDGIEHDPIELSAMVLKKICAYCKEQGEEVQDAVITYPADYGVNQKEAIRKAAELAGINVIGMINDVTAAAMNYARGIDAIDGAKVLLYHLGGGTFSTGLMQLTYQDNGKLIIQMLGYNGDNDLGGVNWDQSFEDLVKRKFAKDVGCSVGDISQDVTLSIRAQVEKMKRALSEKTSITFRFTDDEGNRRKIPVSREEFDEATSLHLDKTMPLVESVLLNNIIAPEDVDVVLLDGGSTLMPQVGVALSKIFGRDKIILSDPYQSIAKWSAIIADNIRKWDSPNIEFSHITIEPIPSINHNAHRSPISFGFVMEDDYDEMGNAKYVVHNFLKVGETVPDHPYMCEFITNNETQASIVKVLATSLSPDALIPVKRETDGTFYSDDASIDLKTITWRIPLRIPHEKITRIQFYFSMNRAGEILLEAESPEVGSCELELAYRETYAIEQVNRINRK